MGEFNLNFSNFKLGKKGENFDFSKLKAGITENSKNSAIFKKLDTNNNGVLEKSELEALQTNLAPFAEDGVVTDKEAKKLLKSYGLTDTKASEFFEFLQSVGASADEVQDCFYSLFDDREAVNIKYKPDENGFVRTSSRDAKSGAVIQENYDNGVESRTIYYDGDNVSYEEIVRGAKTTVKDSKGRILKETVDKGGGLSEVTEYEYDGDGTEPAKVTTKKMSGGEEIQEPPVEEVPAKKSPVENENKTVFENGRTLTKTEDGATLQDEGGEPVNIKYDKDGNILSAAKEGETFTQTAERLGIKKGTPEFKKFKELNAQAAKRGWFRLGVDVKIPAGMEEKINIEGLNVDSDAEMAKFNRRVATKSEAANQRKARVEAARQQKAEAAKLRVAEDAKLKELGLINRNGEGSTVTCSFYNKGKKIRSVQLTKIGDATHGRSICKDKNGKVFVVAHDGVILKNTYVQVSAHREVVQLKNGRRVAVDGSRNDGHGRSIVYDADGKTKVMSQDRQVLRQDYVEASDNYDQNKEIQRTQTDGVGYGRSSDGKVYYFDDKNQGRAVTGEVGQQNIQENVEHSNSFDELINNFDISKLKKSYFFRPQRQGLDVAKDLYDDIHAKTKLGLPTTGENFDEHVKDINANNVLDVLKAYDAKSPKETLIEAIFDEIGMDKEKQIESVTHIKDALIVRSNNLGIEVSVLNTEFEKAFEDATTGALATVKYIDTEKLDKLISEYTKRIDAMEKMDKAARERYIKENGFTELNNEGVAIVSKIMNNIGINSNDALGNGKIDNPAMQITGNCWAHSGINAMIAVPKGKEMINNLVTKKDGVVSVCLPEAAKNGLPKPNGDGIYTFTEWDISRGLITQSAGDGDVTAVMLALDKYFEETGENHGGGNRMDGNTSGRMFEILSGKKSESFSSIKIPDGVGFTVGCKNSFFYSNLQKLISEGKGAVLCSLNGGADGQTSDSTLVGRDHTEQLKNGNPYISGGHAYAITKMDDDFVYLIESNQPDSIIKMPKEEFQERVHGISTCKF